MGKIIIVEGIDRVGKSTLVSKIVQEFGYRKFIAMGADLTIRKSKPKFAKIIETEKIYATLSTLFALREFDYKIIFDRFHISEYVYGYADRGYINFECFQIDEILSKLDTILIHVHPVDIIKSSQEHGSKLNKHYDLFCDFVQYSKIPTKYECDYNTMNKVIEKLKLLNI